MLLGAYQSLKQKVHEKSVRLFPRRKMLSPVIVDGQARGIIARNLVTGEIEQLAADSVCYLSTNSVNSNVSTAWRALERGAMFANP